MKIYTLHKPTEVLKELSKRENYHLEAESVRDLFKKAGCWTNKKDAPKGVKMIIVKDTYAGWCEERA